jgi:hypothetical protein
LVKVFTEKKGNNRGITLGGREEEGENKKKLKPTRRLS